MPRTRHTRRKEDDIDPKVVVGGFVALLCVAIGFVLHSSMAPKQLQPVTILQRQSEAGGMPVVKMARTGNVAIQTGKGGEFADIVDWAELVRACPCIYAPGSDTGLPPEFCTGHLQPHEATHGLLTRQPLCGIAWAHYMVRKTVSKHEPALLSGGAVIHYVGPDARDAERTAIDIYNLPTHGLCMDNDKCEANSDCLDQTVRKYWQRWPQKYNIHERLGTPSGQQLTCRGIASAGGCEALEQADLTHLCSCSCAFVTTERTARWMEKRRKLSMPQASPMARSRPRHHPDKRTRMSSRRGAARGRKAGGEEDQEEDEFWM
jgi:hypothetical protein